ncbi:uncharacterized protein UTRI_10309 [Ustilago trichophora]|uniref:Uncharacterized protein n=1 Tax=Ustilago trichophora TaxID=86804 RepID=A0A5C3EPJ4_9BASI|nr:uncharacterized protein UTRI_10309 [Ustilago trichophora]
MEIDKSDSGRHIRSASSNSGLTTSSRQENQIDQILSDFLAQTEIEHNVFRLNLTIAFNKSSHLEARYFSLDSCLKAPVFKSLVSTLGQSGDDLPLKFINDIFHTSTSPRVVRPYNSNADIIQKLDKKQFDRADNLQCLLTLFQCAYRADASRQTVNVVRTTPTVNFNDRFYGDGLLLLESHITIHNDLFHVPSGNVPTGPVHTDIVGTKQPAKTPDIARHYYSKVLPIIQSSGFGKTRTCVQLSTNSPGMLVCLRSNSTDSPYHDSDYVSFPPQDSKVFEYFAKHNIHYPGNEKPTTQAAHQDFNLVHLAVLAWLSAYCRAIAFYLAYLKQMSPTCFSARRTCTSDPQLCWSTVVFQLANAIHTSDFIPHRLFRERAMCPNNDLVKIFSHNRDPPESFVSQQRRQQQKEQKEPKEQNKHKKHKKQKKQEQQEQRDPPHLYCTQKLRSQLLEHICKDAKRINTQMLKAYSGRLFYKDLLLDAISDFLRENLHSLEDSTPKFANQPFFFLALDECGSMANLLPVIRRVWFHALPRRTWILLVDTNSDLAPLAGRTAREGSRRMNPGGTHLLTQPFSTMPLDVNFPPAHRRDVFDQKCKLTFKELNQMLPRLGRPLWYDISYHHEDGTIKPREIIGKLVIPHWMWDHRVDVIADEKSEMNQNLLALVSRRINLEITRGSNIESWYAFIQNQVAQHLRFVGRIFTTSDAIITNTPSEPPLSAAAAWFFRGTVDDTRKNWSMVVLALARANASTALDLGAKGEQGIAILCAMAIDLAISSTYSAALGRSSLPVATASTQYEAVFGLVSVRQWLHFLIGDRVHDVSGSSDPYVQDTNPTAELPDASAAENADPMDEDSVEDALEEPMTDSAVGSEVTDVVSDEAARSQDPELPPMAPETSHRLQDLSRWSDRAYINFKHIVRLEEQHDGGTSISQDLLVELWLRHAAAEGIANQPAWDLLIPVYMSADGKPPAADDKFDKYKLSYVAIQVKNLVGSPSQAALRAPVGPRLSPQAPQESLELFIDLNGHHDPLGHAYSQRRHPAPKPDESKQAAKDRNLLRHHILISGHNEVTFPKIGRLIGIAKDNFPLLFGHADSLDTAEFDEKFSTHVRRQSSMDPWMEAQVRVTGALVGIRPLTKASKTKRKARLRAAHAPV